MHHARWRQLFVRLEAVKPKLAAVEEAVDILSHAIERAWSDWLDGSGALTEEGPPWSAVLAGVIEHSRLLCRDLATYISDQEVIGPLWGVAELQDEWPIEDEQASSDERPWAYLRWRLMQAREAATDVLVVLEESEQAGYWTQRSIGTRDAYRIGGDIDKLKKHEPWLSMRRQDVLRTKSVLEIEEVLGQKVNPGLLFARAQERDVIFRPQDFQLFGKTIVHESDGPAQDPDATAWETLNQSAGGTWFVVPERSITAADHLEPSRTLCRMEPTQVVTWLVSNGKEIPGVLQEVASQHSFDPDRVTSEPTPQDSTIGDQASETTSELSLPPQQETLLSSTEEQYVRQALLFLKEGRKTARQIAARLGISAGTFRKHHAKNLKARGVQSDQDGYFLSDSPPSAG